MTSVAEADRLYREGRLRDAIDALNGALREDPTDLRARTFLFELLCFAGDFDRARAQLDGISTADMERGMAAALYKEALHAQEERVRVFREGDFPAGDDGAGSVSGTLNGEPFDDLRDADPRVGARLETILGGRYTWLSFRHLRAMQAEPPSRLRDLYWFPAQVEMGEEIGGGESQVFVPAMTPTAWEHPDEEVRLGRVNEWQQADSGHAVPVGRKMWLVDGEEFPLLEVRELRIARPEA